MKCSLCKKEGHNKRSCREPTYTVECKPSTTDVYWIEHGNLASNHGKWMLFYDRSRIDAEWSKMKKLYDESKLGKVVCMKVSGSKENPRASSKNEHVIILYCPECREGEDTIMDIGKRIVENLSSYTNEYIYYKSNVQTVEGTRATGNQTNHQYKLSTRRPPPVEDNPIVRLPELPESTRTVKRSPYCSCGRKNEEDSFGCSRYPGCVNHSDEEDSWY